MSRDHMSDLAGRAEQEQRVAGATLLNAEQVALHRDQAEELVRLALGEEREIDLLLRVGT